MEKKGRRQTKTRKAAETSRPIRRRAATRSPAATRAPACEGDIRFRALIQNSTDLIAILDGDGRIAYISPSSQRMLGFGEAEMVGQSAIGFVHPDDLADVGRALSDVVHYRNDNKPTRFRIRHADGRYVQVESLGANLTGFPGIEGIVLNIRDISERQEAEERRSESEQTFRAFIEQSSDGFLLVDGDGRVQEWNDALARLTGIPRREAVGRSMFDIQLQLIPAKHRRPEYIEAIENRIRLALQTGAGPDLGRAHELEICLPDGTPVPIQQVVFPIRTGRGIFLGAIFQDISERKRTERELQAERQMLGDIIEFLPDATFVIDRDKRVVAWNRAAEAMTGVKKEALLGAGDYAYAEPFFGERRPILIDLLDRPDESVEKTYRHFRREGSFLYAEAFIQRLNGGRGAHLWGVAAPLFDRDGRRSGAIGVVRDVTAARQAEEALHDSRSRLAAFMEHSPSLVLIKDAGLRPVYANRLYHELFPIGEWLGRTPEECFPPEVAADLRRRDTEALERGHVQYEEQWTDRQGASHCFNTQKFRIDRPGLPPMLGVILTDISRHKQAEEERLRLERQVLQAQKMESLGILAGGIAHDFNNLLTAILGNLDLARMNLSPAAPSWRNLEQAQASTLRAAELARQMLAYSGKGRFVVESIDVNELVAEMTHMLQVSISKKALLRFRLASGLPAIEADATQVRQVIMNLVINASDAIGDREGVISLATGVMRCDREYLRSAWLNEQQQAGDYVFIEVGDSGCGMDAETQARIFDPFYSTKFTGRGLGLAAVLGIVRGHNGAIKVYSEIGRGSSFKVFLPAGVGARAVAEPPAEEADSWRGSGTVLLTDDEPGILEVGSEMLQRLGFDVVTAGDGRQAIDAFRRERERIRCVILDLTMPVMDGEEAFRELRRIDRGVRVILSSGYNEQEVTQRFSGRGLDGFIQKPYRFAALRLKLKEILGG